MAHKIGKVEVWAGDLANRPGMLARALEALANAGANLEFVIARRVTANTARAFFAPVKGAKQVRAARDVGLQPAAGLYALRVEGPDQPGLGARLTRALASAGLNVRGLSAASVGKRGVCYFAFNAAEEAQRAAKVLKKALAGR